MTFHARTGSFNELLWFNNNSMLVQVSSEDGKDGISVIEGRMPYGESPPLHVHRNEDEIFHILQGTMRFRVDGKDIVAHAGQTVLAPKGIPHTFRVESVAGAHCLTITTGGDFERMVREVSRPAMGPGLPPAKAPTAEAIATLTAACARHNIDIIGAPLGA